MATYWAVTALRRRHGRRAAGALRDQLDRCLADAGDDGEPDWAALRVSPPRRERDTRGRVWWCYEASVTTSPASAPEAAGIPVPRSVGAVLAAG
ncbi:hypothetical protein [Geodermatophilus sp. FMUSA9-8]|uniref:hypothetical protein n=1 Tax=Geodermatophilus sp. FMUSA9-8 TaxID=3120155 RepID=UPI00300AE416